MIIFDKTTQVPQHLYRFLMDDLNHKLNNIYSGKVVRKDLTKRIKEGANVPVYVLEYLLGMYCATDDEVTIEEGVTRVKNILARLIPLCENNYNCCELGPRSTGKSHVYKEVSPNSILVSGGKTTVANLFYNMSTRRIGLVGLFDVVAFDEVAGISFHDNDGVQIMKDYMASGSFARGKAEITATASMVFVGNINQSVESLVRTSHLLAPFPETMIDTAFFDRFHAYIPGWEIPKFSPENFTNQYGFIVDYLAEWLREMRKRSFADAIDRYFRLGNRAA
nr:BREX system Lon protease-like protein BrxL [Tolypothrix sp. LEGE 11397]